MHFYSNKEAAAAIAAEIHPNDLSKQESVSGQYWHLIYDALLAGQLIGRDLDARIAIDPRRDGRALIFRACLVSEIDLNTWLRSLGVGVQVDSESTRAAKNPMTNLASSTGSLPDTVTLAQDLAPFLSSGKDIIWLKKTLSDLRHRPGLRRYRTITKRPRGSLWRPAGVVIWLITNGHMSLRAAKSALKDRYPDDYDMLPD